MTDQQLKDIIQKINKEQVSDDVNLWPAIMKQIEAAPKRRTIMPHSRTGWLIAALIALLTVGAAAAAVDRLRGIGGDSGLEAVDQQGLITHLNLTKSDGNVSVTLDYAYADSNRISVGYVLNVLLKPDDTSNIYPSDELRDDNGHTFIGVAGGGGGGGGGGGSEATPTMVLSTISHETDYDVFESLGTPDKLNLTLHIEVLRAHTVNSLQPGTDEKLAVFDFPFSIPFYPGLVMATPQTISAAGIAMTLQRFVVTPSMTRAVVCFDTPPAVTSTGGWSPNIELSADGNVVAQGPDAWIFSSATVGNTIPANCQIYALPQALAPHKGDWKVTVMDLYMTAFEGESLTTYEKGRLRQYGINLIPHPEGGYTYDLPQGMSQSDLGEIIRRIDRELIVHIPGPWEFNIKMG